ncbi:MAG: diaminopimelate epimerase [Bacteroidales bacterium]
MTVHFYKYQGTGNDFIILDNRENSLHLTDETVAKLCHRRFGIGADGLMLLGRDHHYDFSMKYYNSDGREGSMCGNGGRCMVSFANSLGLIGKKTRFMAVDGVHEAEVTAEEYVKLRMSDVDGIRAEQDHYFLNTGSPHAVLFVEDVNSLKIVERGREIRYSNAFQPGGTNVNFVQVLDRNTLYVRTYERGVEDETLSCGTGVTASSLAASLKLNADNSSFNIRTLGGNLVVSFTKLPEGRFNGITLEGPAKRVFEGEYTL